MATKKKPITTDKQVKVAAAGKHGLGGNLYLFVAPTGSRSWVFRYMQTGKAREMGLGSYPLVSLAEARQKAEEARDKTAKRQDPLKVRAAQKAAQSEIPTFWEAAEAHITSHKAGWANPKHVAQWTSTLREYAKPYIGHLPINEIGIDDVLKALTPIWETKNETASRVRMRVEAVISSASVGKAWAKPNPAQWRGVLSHKLPKPSKVKKVEHFTALPYKQLPGFMTKLDKQEGVASIALAFTILTAARTGMTIGAKWKEIDGKLWTIPAERMKAGKEHVVPLPEAALKLLKELPKPHNPEEFIFPGGSEGHLSNMAMPAVLRRMKVDVTVHGFRSTFKDWASETTSYANEVSEAALAHTIKNRSEAAYRRGGLLEKRKRLMQDWATYTSTK
ncbi:tyrosine-type recombinase/integrase [Lysobacter sp. GCM10012299]|uniref:tyrosine-type recombinase/integrase n=1 Tax=Lysobacter sp. GCM10012299 TaxID=3317333 RepID=UPI0036102810